MSTLRLAALALFVSACFDPVHDQRVDSLGPEAPGEETGPLHRAGQPCTVCHGDEGPGDPAFGIAGTVFWTPADRTPLVGAAVSMLDERLRTFVVDTNEAGNFYVEEGDFPLTFPLWVSVTWGGRTVDMKTPVFRATACADCHADPPGSSSVGRVYFEALP